MYAIIRTGGKQYKVTPGEVLRVEKLDAELGSELTMSEVLMVGGDKTFLGTPTVANAKVTAVVTNQAKAPKILVFKKKRRQGYRRMQGHRQPYTEIFITAITSPEGQTAKADQKPQIFDPAKREARLEKLAEMRKQAKAPGAKEEKKASQKKVAKKTKKVAKKTGKKVTKKKTAKKATKKASKKKSS